MNDIHQTCIVEGRVELGEGNVLLPYTIVLGPTRIGDHNLIGPNVVIGSPGQDTRNPRHDASDRRIEIGSHNIIREFTAIQKPCYRDLTRIGDRVFLMHGVHIPHDAVVHDDVVITPGCVLAGTTTLLRGANLGLGVTIHQNSVIGHYAFCAMGSTVTRNLRPFTVHSPGKRARVNRYAVEKFEFQDFTDEIERYVGEGTMPTSDRLLALAEEFERLHRESGRPLYQ